MILKKALVSNCPVQSHNCTSSNESLNPFKKCVHLHEFSTPLKIGGDPYIDARCIITTQAKPLHIFSIIPFQKRATSSTGRVREKLDVRNANTGRKLRQTSTSRVFERPMSSAGENQPFDPFDLLGIERRTDGMQEVSYGHLLVPSKSIIGKNGVSLAKFLISV